MKNRGMKKPPAVVVSHHIQQNECATTHPPRAKTFRGRCGVL
nr:MAG TPA: hypothetical protein [Caudoviricetes sp.]